MIRETKLCVCTHSVEKWKIWSHQKIFRQIKSLANTYVTFTKFLPEMRETKSQQFPHSTLWKLQKCTLTEKRFRQFNYLVTSLVKLLLSQNFCQKRVSLNFRKFHSAVWQCRNYGNYSYSLLAKNSWNTMWKLQEFFLTQFWQKFRESNGFTK